MITNAVILSMVISLLAFTINSDNAFGQSLVVKPAIGWYFDNTIEDIEESFCSLFCNPEHLAKIKIEHSQRQQGLIDELEQESLPIPFEVEERRVSKLSGADGEKNHISEGSDKRNALQKTIDGLIAVGELNEIRVLYSQIDLIKDSDEATKNNFNARVNSLKSWDLYCKGDFDVREYEKSIDSWNKLKHQCSALDEWEDRFGFDKIRATVSGNV